MLELFQAVLEQMDALVQLAPVQFQPGFARAARAHRKFLLPHIAAQTHQSCGEILELCQFDLHLAFVALRALRENIHDEH